jgi:hypothetical protein
MSQNPKEGISKTGIQGQVLNLLEGEINPIKQVEMS